MNLIETIIKKGKDLIDTITLTRKLRISRDEQLLYLEKNTIDLESRMHIYIQDGLFLNAETMYNGLKENKKHVDRINEFWEFINKDNK